MSELQIALTGDGSAGGGRESPDDYEDSRQPFIKARYPFKTSPRTH